jgi:AhpD family alkylhydroperoxidase
MKQTDPEKMEKSLRLLKELKASRGKLEEFHKRAANDPDLMKTFIQQFDNCYKSLKHIPRKYQELIMMAVGCARNAQTTINVHARLAAEHGATTEELGETLRLVFLLCGSISLISGVEIFEPIEIEKECP